MSNAKKIIFIASLCDSIYSKTIMSVLLDEILELPVAERIKLVGDIWESIAVIPDAVEITVDQKAELDRRMDDYRRNPENTIPWETIKAEAIARK